MVSLLSSISYVSSATSGMTPATIDSLLSHAVRRNIKEGISGILLYNNNSFLQVLEGNTSKIHKLYAKIKKDIRHHHIITLEEGPVKQRIFEGYKSSFSSVQSPKEIQQLSNYLEWVKLSENKEVKSAISFLEHYIKSLRNSI